MVTSRHIPLIEHAFRADIKLEIIAQDADIEALVEARISKGDTLERLVTRTPSIKEKVITTVVEKARGMYVLFKLPLARPNGIIDFCWHDFTWTVWLMNRTANATLQDGQEPDLRDGGGATPLHRAVQEGRQPIVKLLLETGKVDINTRSSDDRTALIYAAKGGHSNVVKLLLDMENVDVDARDRLGETAINWAAMRG